MTLNKLDGEYAIVDKVDVSNLADSVSWYTDKLGMTVDTRFRVPGSWEQLNFPNIPRMALGLNNNASGVGTGGQVTTIVVTDIVATRDDLMAKGVEVGPIEEPGDGVQLAFFKDPDENQLGLRQNPSSHPSVSLIGE